MTASARLHRRRRRLLRAPLLSPDVGEAYRLSPPLREVPPDLSALGGNAGALAGLLGGIDLDEAPPHAVAEVLHEDRQRLQRR